MTNLHWTLDKYKSLHAIPEVSHQERETSTFCTVTLQALGFKTKTIWEHGFIASFFDSPTSAEISSSSSARESNSKLVAFRADMDALPIAGGRAAHLCGHDIHMAAILLLAKIISDHRTKLITQVRFIMQPSEEISPGGAKFMIESGALIGVDSIYGFHNDPQLPVNTVKYFSGSITANCDRFSIMLPSEDLAAALQLIVELNKAAHAFHQSDNEFVYAIQPHRTATTINGVIEAGIKENIIPSDISLSLDPCSISCPQDGSEESVKIIQDGQNCTLKFSGHGGHAAYPERADNLLLRAATFVLGAEDISCSHQRQPNEFKNGVLTISYAKTDNNHVVIKGVMRTFGDRFQPLHELRVNVV